LKKGGTFAPAINNKTVVRKESSLS